MSYESESQAGNHRHGMSFLQASLNCCNVLVGAAILSLPYAFRLTGWLPASCLLLLFMLLTNYTARLLAYCLDHPPVTESSPFSTPSAGRERSNDITFWPSDAEPAALDVPDNEPYKRLASAAAVPIPVRVRPRHISTVTARTAPDVAHQFRHSQYSIWQQPREQHQPDDLFDDRRRSVLEFDQGTIYGSQLRSLSSHWPLLDTRPPIRPWQSVSHPVSYPDSINADSRKGGHSRSSFTTASPSAASSMSQSATGSNHDLIAVMDHDDDDDKDGDIVPVGPDRWSPGGTTGVPQRLCTYSDIGRLAFDWHGSVFISVIFTLELFAAAVALVILSADSLHTLFPRVPGPWFKGLVFVVVTPTLWFSSLRWLSYTSLLGLFIMLQLLAVIVFDGLDKWDAPGSLRHAADTSLLPVSWLDMPMSLGLVMAGFAGHAVFPSIYRGMRHPNQFGWVLNVSYAVALLLYGSMGALGYFMFGRDTQNQITKNLASIPQYRALANVITIWLVAINPMTKYALTLQPVCATFELGFLKWWMGDSNQPESQCGRRTIERGMVQEEPAGTNPEEDPLLPSPRSMDRSSGTRQLWRTPSIPRSLMLRLLFRTVISGAVVGVAILFPGFERVMAVLGSFFSTTVSCIFPIACYMKLYRGQLSMVSWLVHGCLVAVLFLVATVGTLWAVLSAIWNE